MPGNGPTSLLTDRNLGHTLRVCLSLWSLNVSDCIVELYEGCVMAPQFVDYEVVGALRHLADDEGVRADIRRRLDNDIAEYCTSCRRSQDIPTWLRNPEGDADWYAKNADNVYGFLVGYLDSMG